MQKQTTPTPAMALRVSSNLIFFTCFRGVAAIFQQSCYISSGAVRPTIRSPFWKTTCKASIRQSLDWLRSMAIGNNFMFVIIAMELTCKIHQEKDDPMGGKTEGRVFNHGREGGHAL